LLASDPILAGQGVTAANVDPTALNILNLKSNYYGGQFLISRVGQSSCIQPSGTTLKCVISKVAPLADTQYVISYDRPVFNGKSKISGRWFFDNGNTNLPLGTASTLAFPEASIQNNRFLSLAHTYQISNRQLNEFRFGLNRFITSFAPTDLVRL